MTEERITRVETPGEGAHTHTTVITDQPRRGGGAMWLMVLALVVLGVLAFAFLGPMRGSEVAKDNAIADAADNVGAAAGQVGEAAENAADSLNK